MATYSSFSDGNTSYCFCNAVISAQSHNLVYFSGSSKRRSWKPTQPSNENVQQVLIQLDLRVPDGCNATVYHEDLKKSFLESYANKDEWFQMSVQGLGTPTWHLQGRAKLQKEIHHRSARKRIRDILIKCQGNLGLSPPVNQAYSKYLETALVVKPDAEPLSGERRWWRTAAPAAGPALLPAAAAGAPVAQSEIANRAAFAAAAINGSAPCWMGAPARAAAADIAALTDEILEELGR